MKNIEHQIFPECKCVSEIITSILTDDKACMKFEMNVRRQTEKLENDCTINAEGCNLAHLFNRKGIRKEQEQDLMNFRTIGQAEFENAIDFYTLRIPSVKPPKHRKNLATFSERRSQRKKVSDIERERKLQIECWKKRVAFASSTGQQMQNTYQQCIELPRAIATCDGNPTKGTKANTTKVYEKRYELVIPPIIRTSLPPAWIPTTVIMEGMFLINIIPWTAHKNMGEYGDFLIRQHIFPHFKNGATEVHVLFDDPKDNVLSPKFFERQHRDLTNPISDDHYCSSFTEDMVIPHKWRANVLNCRKCKRNLVCFLCQYFLEKIGRKIQGKQRFITAGGFDGTLANYAMYTESNGGPQQDSRLKCNAEETDTRIWLHVVHSAGNKKLVISPDTDVYHVGLPHITGTDLEVMVKLNPFSSLQLHILDMQALISALNNDPDLASIPYSLHPSVLQVLYICTGCDFISFFNGYGKALFMATFFEYCEFICSNSSLSPGILADTSESSEGFLSFIRLVGSAYFKKHKSAFLPSYPTPVMVFNSLINDQQTPLDHHTIWLDFLRERIWSKIKYEEEMIPSITALHRHWKRSCWVASVWSQATHGLITYPPLNFNGWKQSGSNVLSVDWDSDENISEIRTRVSLIRKGCGCKTGCTSFRCKCKKAGAHCGPGCKCTTCYNLPNTTADCDLEMFDVDSETEMADGSDSDGINEEIDEIMNEVFGCSDSDSENYV